MAANIVCVLRIYRSDGAISDEYFVVIDGGVW